MMKRLLLAFLLLTTTMVVSADGNLMFEKANQLYLNKNYDSALILYQQLLHEGYVHSDLYYNTGNAYFRTGEYGMAMWCYQKAILLNPSKTIRDNIAVVQKKTGNVRYAATPMLPVRMWHFFKNIFSINGWALASLAFFLIWLAAKSLAVWSQTIRIPRFLSYTLLSISCLALLMSGLGVYQQTYRYQGVLISPHGKLNEGLVVRYYKKTPGGLKVKLPDGSVETVPEHVFKRL